MDGLFSWDEGIRDSVPGCRRLSAGHPQPDHGRLAIARAAAHRSEANPAGGRGQGCTADRSRPPSLHGPGASALLILEPYRRGRRLQELAFRMAAQLTRDYIQQQGCEVPAHVLFPQLARIIQRYIEEKVIAEPPAERIDVVLSSYGRSNG